MHFALGPTADPFNERWLRLQYRSLVKNTRDELRHICRFRVPLDARTTILDDRIDQELLCA